MKANLLTRRNFLRLAGAGAAGATLLGAAGCGGASGPATLKLQHSIFPDEAQKLLKEYAAAYEKETDTKIEISYVPWENHRSVTLSKIASGNPPDILHSNSNQGSAEFKALGAFADLGPMMSADFKKRLISTAFNEIGTYGLPYIQSPEASVFYRKDMLDEAGIDPPPVDEAWTWDEMVAAAKELTRDANGDGTVDQWGFVERGKEGFIFEKALIPYGISYGSDIVVKEGDQWKSGFETEGMRQAIRTNVALAREHKVRPMSYLNWDFPQAMRAWSEDQIAMLNIGMWWSGAVETDTDQRFMEDFDVMLFPVDNPSNKNVYMTFDYFHVTKASAQPEEAFKFLQFLFEKERLQSLAQNSFDLVPTTKPVLDHEHYSEEHYPLWAERFARWQDATKFQAAHREYNSIWITVAQPVIHSMVQGKTGIEEGLKQLNTRVKAELESQ